MLGTPVAGQCPLNGLDIGMAAPVAVGGQHTGVTLSGDDSAQDAQAGDPHDVRHHVMHLDIHLHQGFLHVLDV